jgi:hypothetical protein
MVIDSNGVYVIFAALALFVLVVYAASKIYHQYQMARLLRVEKDSSEIPQSSGE